MHCPKHLRLHLRLRLPLGPLLPREPTGSQLLQPGSRPFLYQLHATKTWPSQLTTAAGENVITSSLVGWLAGLVLAGLVLEAPRVTTN